MFNKCFSFVNRAVYEEKNRVNSDTL